MNKKVIDISKWNPINDYEAASKVIDGVIIRCGYRKLKTGVITEDPLFKNHITEFNKLEVPVGIYFFTTAINEHEAKEEANYAVSLIKSLGIELSFPIAIDTEYSNESHTGRSDKLSKDDRTKVVVAFCERIIELGYEPMIYCSDSWFKYNLNYNDVKKYKKWVADYSNKPSIGTDNLIGWQRGKTSISGIPKQVDDNIWYADIKDKSKNSNNSTNKTKLQDGDKVELKNVNLFASSTTSKVVGIKTGTYYIWSSVTRNKRVRITNKKENVKKNGAITGWINISDI